MIAAIRSATITCCAGVTGAAASIASYLSQLAFSQSAVVHFEGTPLMTVNAVEATVGEDDLEPMVVAVDAAVSWMLRNALTGGRLWFSAGGEIHETET